MVCFVVNVELEVCVDVVIGKEVVEIKDVVELAEADEEGIGFNVVEDVGLTVVDVNSLLWVEVDVDVTVVVKLCSELGFPTTSKGTVTHAAMIPKRTEIPTPIRISFVLCRFKKYVYNICKSKSKLMLC